MRERQSDKDGGRKGKKGKGKGGRGGWV